MTKYLIESTSYLPAQDVGLRVWQQYVENLKAKQEASTNHTEVYVEGMEDWKISSMDNITPDSHPRVDFSLGDKDGMPYLEFSIEIPDLINPDYSKKHNPFMGAYKSFQAFVSEQFVLSDTEVAAFETAVESIRKELAGDYL